ncbi:MAG: hypothetical protein U0869_25440 [Chloroflexota bacterium]
MDQSMGPRAREPQAAGQPAIPLDVLADRYHAALNVAGSDDPRGLQLRLWKAYRELLTRVTRLDWHQPDVPGAGADGGADLIAELDAVVRAHIIRRVDELGIARGEQRTVR